MKLNRNQIYALKKYAEFTDVEFKFPYQAGVRASTCFALYRRGLLEQHSEPWDWTQFRINETGRKEVAEWMKKP